MNHTFLKAIFAGVGALWAIVQPTAPLLACCTFAVILDCVSAYRLGRRVHRSRPGLSHGKPASDKAKRIFNTLCNIYSVILLCYLIDAYCLPAVNMGLANILAGVFCLVQVLSILENISSCNNSRWAELAQKILIDKTARHLDIELTDALKNDKKHAKK